MGEKSILQMTFWECKGNLFMKSQTSTYKAGINSAVPGTIADPGGPL